MCRLKYQFLLLILESTFEVRIKGNFFFLPFHHMYRRVLVNLQKTHAKLKNNLNLNHLTVDGLTYKVALGAEATCGPHFHTCCH